MRPFLDIPKSRAHLHRDFACAYCVNSRPARGSLGGMWLYCDHPESFKRYVRYHQTCECFEFEDYQMSYCLACGAEGSFNGRNPFCPTCAPVAAQHVVSMTRAAITGDSVATCRCGWQRVAPWTHAGRQAQEDEVHDHWRAIVAKETT